MAAAAGLALPWEEKNFARPFRLERLRAWDQVMDIEIVVVGESGKWVLNQPRIRIGVDPQCEVSLPAQKYPTVSGEHAALDVADGLVRLSGGETYLNGHLADNGTVLRSGDVLRLGAGGPELRLRLLERTPASHEPTRVLYQPAPASHEPTRVISEPAYRSHEATRVLSSPEPASAQPHAAAARQGHATQAAYGGSAAYAAAAPHTANYGQHRGQEAPLPAVAQDSSTLRALQGTLKSIQVLLAANLALVALLFVWVFMQGRELAQTHKELQELRVQAQNAVGQLTPSLDARLGVFERRMDAMDTQVAAAQDRMVKGIDAQAKLAEDRMVSRMNTEIPAMLDKFVSKKLADIKH